MENGGQLTFEDDPLFVKQNNAHKYLEEGNFNQAISLYESILKENPNFPGVSDGIKASRFWINKKNKLTKYLNSYDKGKILLKEWRSFEKYMSKNHVRHGRSTAAIQKYIFCDIIESFTKAYNEGIVPDTAILIQIGDLFKRLGNYEKAIDVYEYTRGFKVEDSSLLAKLGDCYFVLMKLLKRRFYFAKHFSWIQDKLSSIKSNHPLFTCFIKKPFGELKFRKLQCIGFL